MQLLLRIHSVFMAWLAPRLLQYHDNVQLEPEVCHTQIGAMCGNLVAQKFARGMPHAILVWHICSFLSFFSHHEMGLIFTQTRSSALVGLVFYSGIKYGLDAVPDSL